jgi:hypothetical protein
MPVLAPGTMVRSRTPTVLVENRLEAGNWRFRLTVVDDAGNESAPAELVVRVVAPSPSGPAGPVRPTGPVRPIDPRDVRPVRPVRPPG